MPDHTARPHARPIALAVVTVVFLIAAACGSSSSGSSSDTTTGPAGDEGTPVDGGSLVWGVPIETDGWNPHYNQVSGYGTIVASSVLEPLATYDTDLNAVPWLATSWTPNATYDQWTLKLQTGVTFQNGQPFDAAAVKANMDDVITGSLSSTVLAPLFSATTVVDPATVQVNLAQPWASFPESFLANQSALQMAPEMLEAPDHGSAHPIGTGPFRFSSWQPGGTFETVKNATYWKPGLPHLDAMNFTVLPDATSRSAALQSGTIDIMVSTNAADVAKLGDQYTVIKNWDSTPGMVITNTIPEVNGQPNPLNNVHARRALAYATDQTALAAIGGEGVQTPTSPFPVDSPWGQPQDQDKHLAFDLDAAKQEVDQYKTDTGASELQFTLRGASDPDTVPVLQALQSQWSEAGIKVNVDSVEAASLITDVVFGRYDAVVFPIYSSLDPDQNAPFWSADTANGSGEISINFSQFTNPQMEADLQVGRTSPDRATRKSAYDDLVQQINEAAVNIWTYATPISIIADPDIRGLGPAREIPFANFAPKTWLAGLWVSG